jgi:hypothetical protein
MEAGYMTRTVLTVFAVALASSLSISAIAQDTKSARGVVTAVTADAVTVKAGSQEMKFMVDAKTTVTAEGGSTATREATAAGKPGAQLAELIKVGNAVEVTYHETKGTMHAARIRRVSTPGSGGGTTSDQAAAAKTELSNGIVDAVSATSLTITGSAAGGATFKQTFTIDGDTRVVAQGASTATAASGGKTQITSFVGKGDSVTVTYHKTGSTLHAAEVRVRQKSK